MNRQNEYSMAVRALNYWKNKKKFGLPVDRYESWALFIVEEGTFQYTINGITNQASTGEIVVCPPNTEFHREVVRGSLTFHYVLFDWRDTRSQIEEDMRSILSSLPLQKFTIQESDRLASTLSHLRKIERNKTTETIIKQREHFLNDLWILLYVELQSEAGKLSTDAVMEEVKSIIEKQAYGRFYLMDIAKKFKLTKVHLTRRFRQCYGISPMNYLTELRLKRAKLLLTNSDYTLEYIAHACGYNNGNYFCRIFLKHVGMPPSHYRNMHIV